jgi:hypothetical protein
MTLPGRSVVSFAALVLVAVATLVSPLVALADIGVQGPAFPAGVSAPTGEKPESKLWFNDGAWWASMITTLSGTYHIHELNAATQTWTDTGVQIDPRTNSKADVLWDGSSNKLYVASRVFATAAAAGQGRLYRFSYDSGIRSYTLDADFPVAINALNTETLVIAKDSTGKLWATWMAGGTVFVNRTDASSCPIGVTDTDRCWGTPFSLLSIATPPQTAAANADDISTIVAFTDAGGAKVGVMWTDQVSDTVKFSVHRDGDADTVWQAAETAAAGPLMADDHINATADGSGRVYVALKTGRDADNPANPIVPPSDADLVDLLVRSAAGSWSIHLVQRAGVIGVPEGDHTRPIVVIDEANDLIRVYSNATGGGPVFEKTSPRGTILFPEGAGTRVIEDTSNPLLNNVTGPKHPLTAATGVLVMASAVTPGTNLYWHHFEALGGGGGPTVTVVATDNTASENPVTTGLFTVSRTGDTTDALTVNYSIGGTATDGTDYATLETSVVIPAGAASATLTVTPIDEADVEANETVILTLAAGSYTIGSPGSATVNITSDEAPLAVTVAIVATDATSTEVGTTTGALSVSRTGPTTAALTVAYTISGSATNGTDYAALAGSVVIPVGAAAATITVIPVNDTLVEGDETVLLTLSGSASYGIAAPGFATVTIVDRAVVTIVATDPSASEAGLDPGAFTVSRTGPTTAPVTVNYTVTGTATPGAGNDYTAIGTSMVIPAGAATATITVSPLNNAGVEDDETVVVTLSASASYYVGASPGNSATVTIVDNDAVVTIAATDASASEAGPDPGTFTVTRSGPATASALTVSYTVGGTASSGPDYATLTGSVVIPQGASSATIAVSPVDDAELEGNETVTLTLSASSAYVVGAASSATVTIADNDAVVTIVATDATATEAGTTTGAFAVSRTGPSTAALTVNYTIGGSASNGPDYATLTGSVVIPAGAPSATITVTPLNDLLGEGDETVELTLSTSASYIVGSPPGNSGVVTIVDNDAEVTIAVADGSASEAALDPGTFTVSRSGPTTAPLTVSYTVGGTASNGSDFAAMGTSVVIPAGSASATITVTPVDDAFAEGNETVVVTISPSANYIVGTPPNNSATIIIGDDEPVELPAVGVVATDAAASESPLTTGFYTVTRTGLTAAPLTVNYAVGGTATPGGDYVALPGSLVIPAGVSSATITVTPINDSAGEGSETVVLTISAAAAYNLAVSNSATVTITSEDTVPTVTVTAIDAQAREAGLATGAFGVSRTGSTAAPLTVFYTVAGTATPGGDYVGLAGSVVIPAGAASATITVSPLEDDHHEPNETVVLTLSPLGVYNVGASSSATVRIVSNDPLPTVSITASDSSASEAGLDPGIFTVNRTGSTMAPLAVSYTVGGTAGGSDYVTLPGTVVIPAGSSSTIITVTPNDDALTEGNETVVVTLAADAALYTIGTPGSATVTIGNDDAADLMVTAVSDPPATRRLGGRFSVATTVLNQGNGGAPSSSRVRYYLSPDAVRDPLDWPLTGNRLVPALAAGAQSVGTTTVTIPDRVPPATYFLLACADDTRLVAEGAEGNNCRASTTQIRVNP